MNPLTRTNPRPQNKTRVLIVEDDENAALPMAELLKDLGCEPLVSGEGDLALDLAQIFKPEIVLLDIDLPDMSGYDLAHTLRRMPGMADALLIAITGHNTPEEQQKAYRVGMDLFLAKPLQLNFFKELIGNFGKTLRCFAAVLH